MAWPLANNQIAWICRADLASGAARNRPARSSRLRCAATCTMLVSHEPWRVNLPAASPRATPAERIIRKPYQWVNTCLGNIKTALAGTYHHVSPKHAQRYLASFAYRFNRRFQLDSMVERLVWAAAHTAPHPYRIIIADV
jgi:hypothetical protein